VSRAVRVVPGAEDVAVDLGRGEIHGDRQPGPLRRPRRIAEEGYEAQTAA
jgi:hypothetical protein